MRTTDFQKLKQKTQPTHFPSAFNVHSTSKHRGRRLGRHLRFYALRQNVRVRVWPWLTHRANPHSSFFIKSDSPPLLASTRRTWPSGHWTCNPPLATRGQQMDLFSVSPNLLLQSFVNTQLVSPLLLSVPLLSLFICLWQYNECLWHFHSVSKFRHHCNILVYTQSSRTESRHPALEECYPAQNVQLWRHHMHSGLC